MIEAGEEISIQGDLVTLRTTSISRQVPLEDWLDGLNISRPSTFPVLARSQVFGHMEEVGTVKKLFALTEIPAGIKNITKNLRNGTARRYRLAMPWTYLWFVCQTGDADTRSGAWSVGDYKVFHARQRFNSVNDEMIVARLPNVYADGRICWGAAGVAPGLSLADRLDQLTNEWYLSRFNTDLDGENSIPQGEPNYRRWVHESHENPNCWQNWTEWTDRNVGKVTVTSLMAAHGTTPRMTEIVLDDAIPEVPIRLTFGHWDQWWMNLPPEERARAQISLGNLDLDDAIPAAVEEVIDPTDDGGVEVPFVR